MKTLGTMAQELKGNCLTALNKVSLLEKKHPSSPMEASEQPQVKKAKLEEENDLSEESMDEYNEDDEPEVMYQIED